MAFNLNGFNFNQSVVDSQGRVINTWLKGSEALASSLCLLVSAPIRSLLCACLSSFGLAYLSLASGKKFGSDLVNLIALVSKLISSLCFCVGYYVGILNPYSNYWNFAET
jgi:hypothetical protein